MRRRDFIILLGGAAAASPLAARPRPADVNLKTAKTLGLTISASFLTRADEVIE